MGKYDDLFSAPVDIGQQRGGKYADLFDEQPGQDELPGVVVTPGPPGPLPRRPTLAELVAAALPEERQPEVQTPMAVEGVDTETPPPTPDISPEDIQAQRNLPGYTAPTQEQDINFDRQRLARLIEENLFTPSAAPVEGGKMQPLVSKEVAGVPLSISPSRTVAAMLGGKYPATEAAMRNQIAETISGFTNPDTLASLPGFIVPGVPQAFAIQQMAQMPEKVGAIKDAIRTHGLVSPESGRSIQDLVLSALMAAGAGHSGGIRGPEAPSHILPGGPRPMPDLSTYGPPMPVRPGTIAGDVSRALNDRGFVLQDEPRPPLAPAPTVDDTLAQTQQPPVAPQPTTADLTRQILDRRRSTLARIAQLQPLAENARKLMPNGHPQIEAELAALHAELNNPITNPVVHAPPETARTGVGSETARMPQDIQAQQQAAAAENIARAREQRQPPPPQAAPPPVEIPPEHRAYAGPPQPIKPGAVDTLATKAAEARVRLREKLNKLGSAPDPTILSDLAIIGAYHITRVGRDFGRWVAAMTKEIGKRSPEFWRTLYDKSITQVKEEGQKTDFLRQKAKESRTRLDLSKPEDFVLVDRAVPVGGDLLASVDSGGQQHTGPVDPKLNFDPKLLEVSPPQGEQYRRAGSLLGTGTDPKTVKGEPFGYRTHIMYLTAEKGSGVINVCKFATKDCAGACLGKGGMGTFDNVKLARLNKTKFWHYDPDIFYAKLDREITQAKANAKADGMEFAVRLNGTSDILWEKSGLMEKHPDVQFYDYTKYPAILRKDLPPNYHLTYSYTGLEGSDAFSRTWNDRGVNTAVVFGNGMPAEFLGRPVIDGDVSDLRFLDPKGVIVGLHAKGKALKIIDESPFIYNTPPEDVAIPYVEPRTKAKIMKGEFLGEEAIDAIKDAAPKAGDLKWKRGNPFLDLNEPGLKPDYRTENASVKVSPSGYIRDLFVRPEARGQGEGAALMQQVMADADRSGTPLTLHIGEQRTDLPDFYQKLGFKEAGQDQLGMKFVREPNTESLAPRTPEKGFLERKADQARANRAEKRRQGRQLTGLDPTDLTDLAWILADHINRNGYDRVSFEDTAIAEAGRGVAPHLDELYKRASELVDQAKAAPPPEPAAQNQRAVSDQPHVSSIANRFVDERAVRGEIGDVRPGESVPTADLVAKGQGMAPGRVDEAVSRMMQGGDIPTDDASAIRAEEARLSKRSGDLSRVARENPTDLEAQIAADNAHKDLTDFHNGPVAVLKRNWHLQGKVMQGEIPIDLSTLNGQREAWFKDGGKVDENSKPPPAVDKRLQKSADKLDQAVKEEQASGARAGEVIDRATRGKKYPTPDELKVNLAARLKDMPCI